VVTRTRSESRTSYLPRLRGECRADGGCEPVPVFRFLPQPLAARGGEFVELGPAVVFRRTPVRLEQSLLDQAKQSRIERALFDQQCVTRDLPDAQKNAVAMQGAE
jgi:hypothetical protein